MCMSLWKGHKMIAYFESFGCKVNQYETEIIKSDFRLKGYEITADPAAADVAAVPRQA